MKLFEATNAITDAAVAAQLIKAAADNPVATLLIILIPAVVVTQSLLAAWSRLIRHLNIRAQGWPPPHLDADGDAVEYANQTETIDEY